MKKLKANNNIHQLKKKYLKNKSGQIKVELSILKHRNEEAVVKQHDEH